MKTAKEIYKTIPFNEDYEISNFGNVRSTKKYGVNKTRILKPSISNKGYSMVALSKNGKMHTYTIHNLVVSTFIGERKGLVINHIDGNKENNKVNNLEWCDSSYNIKDMYKRKGVYDKDELIIEDYLKIKSCKEVAEIYKCSSENIRCVLKRNNIKRDGRWNNA